MLIIENGERDESEITVPDDIKAVLPALYELAQNELRPLPAEPFAALMTAVLSIVGGPMSQEDRTNFQVAADMKIGDVPGDLLEEAVNNALDTIDDARKLIPAVINYLEDYPERRRKRAANIEKLAGLAGVELVDATAR